MTTGGDREDPHAEMDGQKVTLRIVSKSSMMIAILADKSKK